ncbi:hypothetical protein DU478_04930 [Thalassococcus profundi]|uniref:DUF4760 domain-containing protein n=1 Tax=Thalassococcus profundi TaxID=2282382 RepID=A0A369TP94_9RHOB|nr:hypothetical protein [Thalassococcus profundi]RDD67088.1 hypothetical protein DU478_04930 [Thalassococcus profundi]
MSDTAQTTAMAGLAALLALWGLYVWRGGSEERLAGRLIFQFFVTIGLPVAAAMGLMLLLVARFLDLDERVWQALIAGLFIATGWLTTAIFAANAQQRDKAEKTRDYHKALYAEIGNALNNLYDAGEGEAHGNQTLARMRVEPGFIPLVPREHDDHIYNAVLDEIEVLPRVTIDAVVSYYSLIKAISALCDDMRGDRFRSEEFDQSRRIAMYSDYLEMRKQAFLSGQHALRLIKLYSEGDRAGAEEAARLSSPDAGRSGRLSGSE